MRCPGGHWLPHRVECGRCTPVTCVDEKGTVGKTVDPNVEPYAEQMKLTPRGLEQMVVEERVDTAEEASMLEAASIAKLTALRAKAAYQATAAIAGIPEMPAPPATLGISPEEYVRQRLLDISPVLLEMKISEVMYGNPARKSEVLSELLDRASVAPRNAEKQPDLRGPVTIVNIGVNPYQQQVDKRLAKEKSYVGRIVEAAVRGNLGEGGAVTGGKIETSRPVADEGGSSKAE